jgi:hypothetical protein
VMGRVCIMATTTGINCGRHAGTMAGGSETRPYTESQMEVAVSERVHVMAMHRGTNCGRVIDGRRAGMGARALQQTTAPRRVGV